MKPNKKNFCGGNFQDWLEVMLLSECNGKCSWCIEKNGFKPEYAVGWRELVEAIYFSKKQNIILLGGEPTLHPDLKEIIDAIAMFGRNVYLTTNGSKLTPDFAKNLHKLSGINISIHHFSLHENQRITGLRLDKNDLHFAIGDLALGGVQVRFNCNLIKGYIDSMEKMESYIEFAKEMGATSVRFAELKMDDDNFVDLYEISGGKIGKKDPYKNGCHTEIKREYIKISYRQMCGMQTNKRPKPKNPEQILKKVLYYDGKMYDGWQKEKNMKKEEVDNQKLLYILNEVKIGKMTTIDALVEIRLALENVSSSKKCNCSKDDAHGCVY